MAVPVLAALIAVSATAAASPPVAAPAASKCRPAGSKTIFSTSTTRVFERRVRLKGQRGTFRRTFACKLSRNFAFRLAESDFVGEDEYSNFAIAGNFLVYSVIFSCAACENRESDIYVHDLRTGKAVARAPAISLSEPTSSVSALVVSARGSAAWIADGTDGTQKVVEVAKVESGQKTGTLLDSGEGIGRKSLRLSGGTISWTNAGQRRTASLR